MVGAKLAIVPGCFGDKLGRVVQNIFGGRSFRSDIVAERGFSTADLVQRLGFQIGRIKSGASAASHFSHVPNLGNHFRVGNTGWAAKAISSCRT
jgi:hypothetical protein